MTWLTPIGFLGLIGLIVLLIIYLIKPNYQNKMISSTFVWKLSLKYRKKRIPVSKLRNILLFLCQVLILTATAFILAQPFLAADNGDGEGDTVIILDASASMQTQVNQKTRLERAADAALADAVKALDADKKVTVILAADKAEFLVREATREQSDLVYAAFDAVTDTENPRYTYGTPDIEGAMKQAEQITAHTDKATVTLYTDTTYLNAGNVNVYQVSDTAEWNAAILDVRATIVENYYRFEIDVASYAADSRITVNCEIFNVNDTDTTMEIEQTVYCNNDEVTTIVLGYVTEDMPEAEAELINENISVFAYEHLYVHISEYDSLDYDNQFYLYGGKKPTLKIQYYSAMPNNYFPSALLVLQDALRDRWAVELTEVSAEPATEGFDIYIFEHAAPNVVPSDGVVIYVNPSKLPSDAGIRFGTALSASGELFLGAGEAHPLMNNVDASRISVTQFTSITSSDGYTPLATYEEYPLLMLKEDVDQKILLLPFSLHYSNLAVLPEFPLLLNNVIGHFFPVTFEGNVYEINDTVTLNARANQLEVVGPGLDLPPFTEFPAQLQLPAPGTYTITQSAMSGDPIIESIYVRIPPEESNIALVENTLVNPYFFSEEDITNIDLLFYFALTVVVLLFAEWWLKSREQI